MLEMGTVAIHWMDLGMILTYLMLMLFLGWYYSGAVKNSEDYFLAGRTLSWFVIGLSIIGSNVGSNDYVGGAGGAYRVGIAQANFEWIGAIPAMILAAFIFIPFYWKAGVYSIPEFLGMRYTPAVRKIAAGIFSFFSLFIIGVFLQATSQMLSVYIGLPVEYGVLLSAFVVGAYTISGGLAAVAISDSVQLFIMFTGGLLVTYFGLEAIGGWDVFVSRMQQEHPQHLQAFLPSDHPDYPWPGVMLGLAFVLSPAYWTANQVILQRTLAARSRWDGQASMIFAAAAKMFIPLLIVMPGLLALIIAGSELENPDQALPFLIKELLPPGVSGLFFVAFIAALQSSVDSTLNGTAVMLTRDIVGTVRKEPLTAEQELKLGRWMTFSILLCGVGFAYGLIYSEGAAKGIYALIQTALSYFQGPMFALLLMGIISKKITPTAGVVALVCGITIAALASNIPIGNEPMNMLYVAFISFAFSMVSLVVVSKFTKPKSDEELRNLTMQTTNMGDAS